MRYAPCLVLALCAISHAATDAEYIAAFNAKYPLRPTPVTIEQIATPALYDRQFMGEDLETALRSLTNDQGELAWGFSYRMDSLNQMYRKTADIKYLAANLRCSRALFAMRDDRTGVQTFRRKSLPAWSSGKYETRGRALFLVHTGMILHPVLEAIDLANRSKDVPEDVKKGFSELLPLALQSLAVHDSQWREGPNDNEGHYVGNDEESRMEGKIQPANRQAAIGRALWFAARASGSPEPRRKALAIGLFLKNRFILGNDNAYYWPYHMPASPTTRSARRESLATEDTSHGALTVSFPILLARDEVVFTREDMLRFSKTILNGFGRLDNGILFADVSGSPNGNVERMGSPARWLDLAHWNPAARQPIERFYQLHQKQLRPIELSALIPPMSQ